MDLDYDDPQIQEQWCAERRAEVIGYLFREQVTHDSVQERPQWFVAPYVSIWRVNSAKPSDAGWWVICGDLPTDYVSARGIDSPRQVMDVISRRWFDVSEYLMRGEAHPRISIGTPESWPELAPLLKARASILDEWSKDEEMWEEDDS
jgi:hypothetical protein